MKKLKQSQIKKPKKGIKQGIISKKEQEKRITMVRTDFCSI